MSEVATALNQRVTAQFFNNPLISDIVIRQTYNSQIHEYYAHKVMLCSQSEHFTNALTGGFNEATDATIELQDYNPNHFEVLLKFVYNNSYTFKAIIESAESHGANPVKGLITLHAIADNYAFPWDLL